jgi:predicted Zn-dependent protease
MSKLLLQLVVSYRDSFYRMEYDNDYYAFFLKQTIDQLNISFRSPDLVILRPIEEIPDFLIDMHRRQCNSDLLLDWLLDTTTFKNEEDKQLANQKHNNNNNNVKLLALCNFDAYSNGLNFVFGQAHMNGKVAAVYLPRLRQEFYALEENENLFLQRVLKEAVHEIGHAFGVGHCPISRCVMHFSNSISDTDVRAKDFCQTCRIKIDDRL